MKTPVTVLFNFIFLSLLFSSVAFTQPQWIVFNSLNSPLEENEVNVVKHDKYDNIWIGTDYGLMKYDGYFWNLYNTGNSDLPSNTVNHLIMDEHSNFWFVVNPSNYPHFLKFDGNEWVKKDTNQTCILHCDYKLFAVDGNEVKWVRGSNQQGQQGIIRFSPYSCTVHDVAFSWAGMQDFQVDHNNHFWLCSDAEYPWGGVAKFDNSQWRYRLDFTLGLGIDTLYSEAWFVGPQWIKKIDFNNLSIISTYYVPFNVYTIGIFAGKDYNLWCQTGGPGELGVLKFDRSSTEFTHYNTLNSGLPSDSVYSYAIDDSFNVWMATQNGLAILNETGIVLKPSISNKDTLDFGLVLFNDTLSISFIISNALATNLTIDSMEIFSPIFTSNDILPVTIEPGNNNEFSVSFIPDSITEYRSKLTLHTDRGMKSILLVGEGVDPSFVYNDEIIINNFRLFQNYPNPFNPVTTIEYQIPERGFVKLKVYDVLGNEITTLVNEEKPAGSYEVEWNATNLPSGIYYYRMKAEEFADTKKLILLK